MKLFPSFGIFLKNSFQNKVGIKKFSLNFSERYEKLISKIFPVHFFIFSNKKYMSKFLLFQAEKHRAGPTKDFSIARRYAFVGGSIIFDHIFVNSRTAWPNKTSLQTSFVFSLCQAIKINAIGVRTQFIEKHLR